MSYIKESKSSFLFFNEFNTALFQLKGLLYITKIKEIIQSENYIFTLYFSSLLLPSYKPVKLLIGKLSYNLFIGFSYTITKGSKIFIVKPIPTKTIKIIYNK